MSLIHDALKRIEQPVKESSDKSIPKHLQIPGEEDEAFDSRKKTRLLALVVVLIAVVGYFIYQKIFMGKLDDTRVQAQIMDAAPAQTNILNGRREEVVQLKETAVKSFELGNLDDAWVRLSTAGQLSPTDSEIWNNMGLISKRRGENGKAREFYEKAIQLKADCAECLNNLAVLDMDEGDFSSALELLEKAISIREEYPEAFFHLAIISEKQGDFITAVDYYKKFLATSKSASTQFLDEVRKHVTDLASE